MPFISGNGVPKKGSYISGNGIVQFTPRKFHIFQETETPKKIFINGNPEKILILPETELSYIWKNGTFLYFGKGKFRTLVYSKPDTYSKHLHIQISTMQRFAKIVTFNLIPQDFS